MAMSKLTPAFKQLASLMKVSPAKELPGMLRKVPLPPLPGIKPHVPRSVKDADYPEVRNRFTYCCLLARAAHAAHNSYVKHWPAVALA
jgi:hypothetical protein